MPPKKNIEQSLKDKYARHSIGTRSVNTRQKRTYHLIVCEGAKTEPYYFNALKRTLSPRTLEVIDIHIEGVGYNTLSLVEKAIEIRKERNNPLKPIDTVWVVFDKDDASPELFNNAIKKCEQEENLKAIWTNEAFELWFLLHFIYCDHSIKRNDYRTKLEQCFKSKGYKNFRYDKTSPEMYSLLNQYGSQEFAIKNAKKLENHHSSTGNNYANMNPCTKVHHLVAELLGIKP